MQGFPGNMMAGDGFPMPDLVSTASRAFGPYGPKFLGDFPGPVSGMMFRGKPSGGFGMMTGRGRSPFMGGMVVGAPALARPGRPVGMPPFFPPSQPSQNSN
ncbi:30-kDa cleavage and polyadenylation specificity factor 30 [Forsythia ovata]|uniref:30-kDa cleavage and polyadenylation specificity factor 30 n=1 Tax=Forsythia ovata TaxID=205694 RepID=A0ABD1R8T8_9LAMI